MNQKQESIHERAVKLAGNFKKAETDLITVLQEVKRFKIYLALECTNMFDYCTRVLGLSRDGSYTYLKIAETSVKVPELKKAIVDGELSVSNARRIATVINQKNKDIWIQKARELPQNKLNQELVKVAPRKVLPDHVRPMNHDTSELRCAVPTEFDELLIKTKDILSQKTQKAATSGNALIEALKCYIQKHDPVEKAKRSLKIKTAAPSQEVVLKPLPKKQERPSISQRTLHQLKFTHDNRCIHRDKNNIQCTQKRWIHVHHKVPLSKNGTNELSNLTLLCSTHHKLTHTQNLPLHPPH